MKLAKLLNDHVYTRLATERQYGLPLAHLYQSQVDHDPSKPVSLADVDGRGTSVILLPKGKHVQLMHSISEAVKQHGQLDLDEDKGGGLRLEAKGLTITIEWRKRTSAERIQDTRERVVTPAFRVSFPHLTPALDEKNDASGDNDVITVSGRVQKKAARHGASYATGAEFRDWLHGDYSELEKRVAQHYLGKYLEAGMTAILGSDGKLHMDLESVRVKALIDPYYLTQLPNCRCAPIKKKPKSINMLPVTLKGNRRESTLPRDMQSGGGVNLKVVGSSYRTQRQQDVLRSKNVGNMVLLAHEPDNDHSKHAVAVFAWANGQESHWHHVGYVQDVLAKGLVDRMKQFGGGDTGRIALKGSFVDDPGLGGNPTIRLDEVWSFASDLRA